MSALAAVRSSQCLHLDGRQLPPRHWQACQTHGEPCAPAEHRRRFKYGTDCNRGIIIAAHVKRGLQTRLWIGWDALFATSRPTPQRQRTCLSLALGSCHTLGSPLPLRTGGGIYLSIGGGGRHQGTMSGLGRPGPSRRPALVELYASRLVPANARRAGGGRRSLLACGASKTSAPRPHRGGRSRLR